MAGFGCSTARHKYRQRNSGLRIANCGVVLVPSSARNFGMRMEERIANWGIARLDSLPIRISKSAIRISESCSRFKRWFQFDPSSIRNSQSAIRNSMALRPCFKLLFQFDPSSIRNSQSAIRNSKALRPCFKLLFQFDPSSILNSHSAIRNSKLSTLLQSAIRIPQSAFQIISASALDRKISRLGAMS